MAFWGCYFTFNGIHCSEYDLMLYDIDGNSQGNTKFASGVSIEEEQLARRWKPLFYGTRLNTKLSFSLVFGVNDERIDAGKFLSRYEMDTISTWLTGHDKYMWLEIDQPDMNYFRYKCMVTGLEMIEYGNIPWAFKATIECDSPFAYKYPKVFEYDVSGERTIRFLNESSHNGWFKPVVKFYPKRAVIQDMPPSDPEAGTIWYNNAPASTFSRSIKVGDDLSGVTISFDTSVTGIKCEASDFIVSSNGSKISSAAFPFFGGEFIYTLAYYPSGSQSVVVYRDAWLKTSITLDAGFGIVKHLDDSNPFYKLISAIFTNRYERNKCYVFDGSSWVIDASITYEDIKGYASFGIKNNTDCGREMLFEDVHLGSGEYIIDCESCVATADIGVNLYKFSNMKFLRLKHGVNELVLTGHGKFKFECEFPVNTGG